MSLVLAFKLGYKLRKVYDNCINRKTVYEILNDMKEITGLVSALELNEVKGLIEEWIKYLEKYYTDLSSTLSIEDRNALIKDIHDCVSKVEKLLENR